MTKEAIEGLSNSARLNNIRGNRKDDRDEERQKRAWPLISEGSDGQQETAGTVIVKNQPQPSTKGYIPPDQPIDDIRKLRETKLQNSLKEQTNGQ